MPSPTANDSLWPRGCQLRYYKLLPHHYKEIAEKPATQSVVFTIAVWLQPDKNGKGKSGWALCPLSAGRAD
jgi:hypothetical protein